MGLADFSKEAQAALERYHTCLVEATMELDDHVSDAQTIAKAVINECYDLELAFIDARAGTHATDLEKAVLRKTVKDRLDNGVVNVILKVRHEYAKPLPQTR